jgi:transcriptional regulator with XRE-family HTH domain
MRHPLTEVRMLHRLSESQFAALFDMEVSDLLKYENGEGHIPEYVLWTLSDQYGINLKHFKHKLKIFKKWKIKIKAYDAEEKTKTKEIHDAKFKQI